MLGLWIFIFSFSLKNMFFALATYTFYLTSRALFITIWKHCLSRLKKKELFIVFVAVTNILVKLFCVRIYFAIRGFNSYLMILLFFFCYFFFLFSVIRFLKKYFICLVLFILWSVNTILKHSVMNSIIPSGVEKSIILLVIDYRY